jgi:hypothetical protein
LLLVDESNPRSVIYQLEAIGRHLADLPQAASGLRSQQERSVLGMLTALKLCDVAQLCKEDARGERSALAALLLDLAAKIPALSDSLSDRYLAHASVSRHLGYDDGVHEPPPVDRQSTVMPAVVLPAVAPVPSMPPAIEPAASEPPESEPS